MSTTASSKPVAIITGAGSGIGAAAARLLAARDYAVVLVGRRRELLEEVKRDVLKVGSAAHVIAIDLVGDGSAEAIVNETIATFGRLDVLINNAAFIQTGSLDDVNAELVDAHYDVNVRAPLLLAKASLDHLRKSPDASIVNVGSSLGSMVMPGTMLYGSTKASLEYLTRAWAYQLAADRIRVNCVAPGVIDTPIHATYSDDLTATYADLARRVPMGRMGTPEEVAEWIWIVISPSTSWSTGNVIHVDGGHVLGIPETAGG
ncbi:MAG: SDR family oxidoreductase [Acidimicrobiales bacterium]|jgi:NAD(P)-dependent dehydrogenase (short-subunit alcohol dehydrogenase family)